MAGLPNARVAVVVARTVDRFVDRFDFAALDEDRRLEALKEIARLRASLGPRSLLIDSAFAKLERALGRRAGPPARPNPLAARKLARMLRALAPLAIAGTALAPFVAAAPAMAAITVPEIGTDITNPATGLVETVAQILDGYAVVTEQNHFILLAQSVNDTFTVIDHSTDPATETDYKVTAITETDGRTTSVTLENLSDDEADPITMTTSADYTGIPDIGGGTGSGFSSPPPVTGAYIDIRGGGNGNDGRAGGGVCFGALGCIEYSPGDGGNGGTPATFSDTIPETRGEIVTTADNEAGIVVVSKGGTGGNGGTGYGNIPPARGGNGGNGGTVSATNQTIVTTAGTNAFGMLVQSVGGRSGSGGNCYIACSGGGPGTPGNGGSATGINEGSITTGGDGAAGLIVQSSGGNSGTGGSSYGIVGDAGSGGYGGNAGSAHAVNNGFILTTGNSAYGVMAQSIGGVGGNSGNAGGIVAFGADGGGGGHGGNASIELGSTSITTTQGNWSHAVFAQSIGGGGGSTGWSAGAASFGSGGGSGGYGGNVSITAAEGAFVKTSGTGSYGIYAQSVGGTGGTAGGSGGIFTMGGSGGTGKTGGKVTVESSATIITTGADARGIFAQSIGGGGGSANTSGGIVALGGSGGTGSDGGEVTITLGEASSIDTGGIGADGVFAQSIGGGGGAGAATGGILALGGTGSAGGIGKLVTVNNAGSIDTDGRLARGIFAQSIGGGGGSGGDGGGLLAIGGSSSSGSAGGDVTVGNTGTVSTGGDFSQGIFAQSVGGGGGAGGDSGGLAAIGGSGSGGGKGGAVTVSNSGLVTTGGNMASAIQAQSVGGGGGDGGSTGGMISIGGSAGTGNDAGTVTANISGGMQTTGDDSHGLFVQSVGGGGGNGGASVAIGAFGAVGIGGAGGAGGKGGTVDVNLSSQTVDVDGVPTAVLPQITTTGDRSRGIFAQSVGGGGGNGGFSVAASAGAFFSASVAIGGSGGAGSEGGEVTLDGDVLVQTGGDNSQGVFIQSVGGGGGAGGFSVAAAASVGEGFSGAFALGIGGTGGAGGAGGDVSGDSGGGIVTEGMYSTGYLAQSVGGGGGAGGFSVAASAAGSDAVAVSASIGLAGGGGGGGDGGTVDVAFDGSIATGGADGSGSDSAGFIAQSIGGGGGTGGFNVSATLGISGAASIGGAIGLGGSGGGGGAGGDVTARVGSVTTTGDRSTGVLIQSLGGGGGSGGFNVSGSLNAAGAFAGGIAVGLGGSGAGGGDGGSVTGTVTGKTQTSGNQSDAVVIQSLGGGGGSGGFNVSGNLAVGGTAAAGISVGLGGSGGTGGDGAAATGHIQDDVLTTGEQSRGVFVQSAGGGGGGGAFNVSGTLTASGTASGSFGVGLGGSGGGGGNGGSVIADATNISTEGGDSAGFIAQSLGGGGGAGSFNVTGGMSFSGTASGSIGVGLGGSGGGGGYGSTVDATVTGDISTQGVRSGGFLAQSVGGGGGSGGFNVTGNLAVSGTAAGSIGVGLGGAGGGGGAGGAVTATARSISTEGSDSAGFIAQSLGGGGGAGSFNVTGNLDFSGTGAGSIGVGLGGSGGSGGDASTVDAEVIGNVVTQGDRSGAILAQSVGGGGGNGGFNIGGDIAAAGTGVGTVSIGLGGSGGTAGNADSVTLDITGAAQTGAGLADGDTGAYSDGIVAQSIGGGGGNGAFNVTGDIAAAGTGAGQVGVGLGGHGGGGGSAGAVTLNVNDGVTADDLTRIASITLQDHSAGIIAQSIGGGGGNGGFNVTGGMSFGGTGAGGVNVGIGGSGGSGNTASAVTADISGLVQTWGDDSLGILAQSVGGGGGNGGFDVTAGLTFGTEGSGSVNVGIGGSGGAGGNAGAVTLRINDEIASPSTDLVAAATAGDRSTGVIAQSLGGGGGNGGFNISAGINISGGFTGGANVGIGGMGDSGGSAAMVNADITGTIGTEGGQSNALLVQSVGGGGGNGAFNVSGGLTLAKDGGGQVGVGVGGFGGDGGDGGAVSLDFNQRTSDAGNTLVAASTLGADSNAVVVQSLGGGGGNGGFDVTGGVSLTMGTGAGNLGVGVGGFGGGGGVSGEVTSHIAGDIGTAGTNSNALLVQSAGGGGGNGGFNVTGGISASKGTTGNLGVGIGGFGGSGGAGNEVISTLAGDVTTRADSSTGVTVQSLGGGGGNGGFNVTGNASLSVGSGVSGNLGVGIGGFGGSGGAGHSATSTVTGNIYTRGSDSYALLVQSQGGGGGSGGFNVTGNLAVSTQGSAGNLGVGIGGFGGDGGGAGDVVSTMTGDIVTGAADQDGATLVSDNSSGATVQSVGGGGGNGGFNVTGNLSVTTGSSVSGDIGVGIGGFGGGGGAGGTVTATQTGDISTRGEKSYGVLVQSAGGGGGSGGFDVTGNIAVTKGSSGTVGVGLGGFGGLGGAGGAVMATLSGDVFTDGDKAYGATIQSLGGAGGSGGMNVAGDLTISAGSGTSIAASVGIGGFGGGGGDASAVTGSATGLYITNGADSHGILVQSAGGGGGAGGLDVSGSIAVSTGTAGSGAVGIGGFGGLGGNGDTVDFTRTGDTFTSGANSNGITVQSVGGGGGAGGINVSGGISATKGNAGSVGFGLGGFGGGGGDGGDVTATIHGNVIATGFESDIVVPVYDLSDLPDDVEITDPAQLEDLLVIGEQHIRSGGSTGILVQSVGGGGGNGGFNVTGALAITTGSGTATGRTGSIGIGGFGGAGGNAGNVSATVAAETGATERVQVQGIGDGQMAFAAQSIGGGGGAGGMNISGGISTAGQLVVGIGGFGGAGGTGSDVTANVDADLLAAGNNSIGFLAQSVGGGGGAGGINISGGIQATTKGKEPEVVFGLGGFGGTGNTAGDVTATQHGQVMVEGQFAYGVLAQSVGGGGGAGGLNISAALTGAGNKARKTEGIAIAAGVGGNGGTGADAGDVSLTSDGNVFVNTVITTNADGEPEFSGVAGAGFAPGVVAQSIGGGGGAGGVNITGSLAPKGVPIAIGVGGTGGTAGNAGNVTLVRGYGEDGPGVIVTYGQGSHGLVAQSIGGGGGNAGFDLVLAANKSKPKNPQYAATVTVGGDGGSSGNGGDVEVQHKGDIYTHGGGSDGILAQSISNGGGSGAMNVTAPMTLNSSLISLAIGGAGGDGGTSGDVSVTHDGVIATDGANSAAIRAQSIGSGGGDVSAEEDLTAFFDGDWPIDVAVPLIQPKNEISVGIGDIGGKGGVAGNVAVNAAGTLITQGEDAPGIHAQSIGGSGGASGAISVSASGENQKGSQGGGVSVSVGLDGGESGLAGNVTVSSSAEIATAGDRSRGIFAQSIGGSGGSGGEASNNLENASNEMHISVGGAGGSGSTAGTVEVAQTGRIDTLGDDADGVLAQSIGGGGGAGGASGTQNLQYEGADSNTVAIAIGGSGGNGATAANVTVSNGGIITTSGDHSFGIRAQSIGGGGGVGGGIDSKKLLITGTSNSLAINVGGDGGASSSAGDVSVVNEGLIWTTGLDAAAISANSIGGGGGDAGSILDLSVGAATSNSFTANIGGMGGKGSEAGDVSVINRSTGAENSGYLITEGDGAYGIFAQSLGGSGGNSSTILSIGVEGGAGSISAGFNFGNSGGSGNLAGNVLVDNGGFIDTSGAGAHGILAQSIGGGGGNGGIVLSGNLNLTNPVAAPLLSIGGSGGDGGDGGDVTVVNSGSIVTRGKEAHGVVAQSIGGGGGNAGVALAVTGEPGSLIISNTLAAALGATNMTGHGGEGGAVTVTHTGDITVLGEGSQAIVAQSINGGGGTLTLDFNQIAAIFDDGGSTSADAPDPLIVARSGSIGSTDTAGGKVTVNSAGTIGVGGAGGVAINLQSIGGGGGTAVLHGSIVAPASGVTTAGLTTASLTTAASGVAPAGFDIALGGVDGSGNAGGDIAGTQEGDIVTEGAHSQGLVIQSVGGGGGRTIASLEVDDPSLAGGSTVSVGGTDQADSGGGTINHVQDGTITTLGDFSIGGLIQGVGGGGGVSAIAYGPPVEELGVASIGGPGVQQVASLGIESLSALSTVTLGAVGGTGNDGGAVSETLTGGAMAAGDYSAALLLQSIGAGGGVVTLSGDDFPQITLGGSGGAEGSGSDISLVNQGAIGSLGTGGYGIILQSIGGGGGAVLGDFSGAEVTLNSDNAGNGGNIAFTQTGDIGALGDSSIGILAQSLGGGGGFVYGQFAGTAGGTGAGGTIMLDVDGSIIAYGIDSTAVLAQSLGSLGGGNIALLSNGDIRGGSGSGIGVSFDGGADNLIDTSGTLSAVSGLAIKTTTGNDTVENRGLIVGNALLGEGANVIHNNQGATYYTIDTLDLQDGSGSGSFSNEGTVELGLRAPRFPIDLAGGDTFDVPTYDDIRTATLYGTQVISQVALDGDYIQSPTGEMWYDVAFGPYASDRIDATGDAAVAGTAHVTLTWLENTDPVTLISTGGAATDLGMEVPDTIALDYTVVANANAIQLGLESNFGQSFLNPNEQKLGRHMDSALEAGGASGIGRLLALLGNLTAGEEETYRDIFDELDPESLLAPAVENLYSARDFSKRIMGCDPLDKQPFDKCMWGRIENHFLNRASGSAAPIDLDDSARLRIGGAVGLPGDWSLGAAIGYDALGKLSFDGDRANSESGEAFHLGIGIGKQFGADGRGSAGLNLAAGWQKMTMVRRQDIFAPLHGTARIHGSYLAADASLGYSFGSGSWFIRPNLDASAIRLSLNGFEESGLDGVGMRVADAREWYLAIEPKLTVGARFDSFHFALTGGGMFSNKDTIVAPMRFIGADPMSDPAIIETMIDKRAFVGGVELGVDASDRLELGLGYHALLGSLIDSHAVNVNLRFRF